MVQTLLLSGGEIEPLDLVGLTVLELFEVQLLGDRVPSNTPLRIDVMAALQFKALRQICDAEPELVALCIAPDPPRFGYDELRQLAWTAYQLWTRNVLIPLARYKTPQHPAPPPPGKEMFLFTMWRDIRSRSFLRFELESFLQSLAGAVSIPSQSLIASARAFSPEPNEAFGFVDGLFKDRLDHLYFGADQMLRVNGRAVRERIGTPDPATRNVPRVSETVNGTVKEISHQETPTTPSQTVEASNVTDIAALAELAELRDIEGPSPEIELIAGLSREVGRGDPTWIGRAATTLSILRSAFRKASDAPTKAAIAHCVLDGVLSREQIAKHFECTVEQMRYRDDIAAGLVELTRIQYGLDRAVRPKKKRRNFPKSPPSPPHPGE